MSNKKSAAKSKVAKTQKKPVAEKTVTGANKQTGKGPASSGRAAKPVKRTSKEKLSLIKKLIALLKKRIKQKKKLKPKNEFRFNHAAGHMNYVFGETESEYKSVGLTTKKETFGRKNMPLQQNPKEGDTGESYVRNGIISDRKRSYSKKTARNYQFSPDDRANVKSKIRHYKKSQKRKKQ